MAVDPLVPLHRRLRIRHLELLAALGEVPSLHRAARQLAMTQPAASKLLVEIEDSVGLALFERTRRGINATPAGAALASRSKRLLVMLDGSRDELQAIEAGALGLVRVGASAIAAALLVPKAVGRLRSQGVPLRVRIEEAGGAALMARLRDGSLDCMIGRTAPDEDLSGLVSHALYDEPAVVVARPGHALARKRRIDWAIALAEEWILPPPGAPLRRIFDARRALEGLQEPFVLLESVSVLGNVTVVCESDALALLPGDLGRQCEAQGLVSVLPLSLHTAQPPVSLLYRAGEPEDGALMCFARALQHAP